MAYSQIISKERKSSPYPNQKKKTRVYVEFKNLMKILSVLYTKLRLYFDQKLAMND